MSESAFFWFVVVLVLFGVFFFVVLKPAPTPADRRVARSSELRQDLTTWGPDQHGVVCYSRHYSSLSCVKVH